MNDLYFYYSKDPRLKIFHVFEILKKKPLYCIGIRSIFIRQNSRSTFNFIKETETFSESSIISREKKRI